MKMKKKDSITDNYNLRSKIKVLLVEDNEMYAKGLTMRLVKQGFEVVNIYNGENALIQLQKTKPDVIVLDLMLEPSMDGFSVIEIIKKDVALAHIPIIMISALNKPEKILYGLSIGANDYIVKPFEVEELAVKIKSIVGLINNVNKYNENKDVVSHIAMYDYELAKVKEFVNIVNNAINNNNDIGIPEIAATLFLGIAKLENLIKKTFNQNPVNYIMNKRLEKADLMLVNSNISVKDIAVAVGFRTTSYFCTMYKRKYGKTPLEIRKINN